MTRSEAETLVANLEARAAGGEPGGTGTPLCNDICAAMKVICGANGWADLCNRLWQLKTQLGCTCMSGPGG